MVANYSSKRLRDAALFKAWDDLPCGELEAAGLTLDGIKAAQQKMQGEILLRGTKAYDQARQISNPVFQSYPVAIFQCKTEADVAIALPFGQHCREGYCVRSGGHCTAGYSTTNGILIDVKNLNHILVDAPGRQVHVGCGVMFGDLYQTLQAYNLFMPGGECPDVCVGGYVQGGGYGFISCAYGMSCDNVLSFRVMLADGSIVTASDSENADLFWALRGGTGGNFGVVLTLTYQLHPVPQASGFAVAWRLTSVQEVSQATDVMLMLQQNFMKNSVAGPEMTMQVSLCFQNYIDPNTPPPPEGTPLEPYLMVRGMWIGDPSRLTAVIQPICDMPGAIFQWQDTSDFVTMNDKLLNYPQGMPAITAPPFENKTSRYIADTLSGQQWNDLLTYFSSAPNNMAYGYAEFYGGAIADKAALDTAFVHRGVDCNMTMDVYWYNVGDAEMCNDFLRNWTDLLTPMSNGHVYQNYPNPEAVNYPQEYWGDAYPTLQMVKSKYDPGDSFRFPQQVRPARAGTAPAPGTPQAVVTALGQPIQH